LHFTYATSYLDRTPNFRADLGFIPRVDIRQGKNTVGYQRRPAHGALVSFGPTIYSRAIWDHRGQMQEWSLETPFSFQFKGPTSFTIGRIEEFERYQNIAFRENASYVCFSTQRLRWMGIDSSFVHGTNINFFPAAGLLPFLSGSDDARLGVTFRPTSRTRVEETYIYNRLGTLASRQVDVRSVPSIFNNHLWRTKVNYQFTRALSIRLIVDYNATLANPLLVNLDRSKRITGDVPLTYLLNPGTALYIGYTDRRENLAFDSSSLTGLQRTMSPFFPKDRQLFVKISYLFRF